MLTIKRKKAFIDRLQLFFSSISEKLTLLCFIGGK